MDSDEELEIITDSTYLKRNKKKKEKKERKKRLNKSIGDNILVKKSVKLLLTLIIIFLFLNLFQFILLLNKQNDIKKTNKQYNLKKGNNALYKNEINITKIIDEKVEIFVNSLPKFETNDILEFRKINSQNKLYDNTKYKKSENPDVSVVLTMNNQAHCIHKALRSIQNQSLKNIEIIVSIDCSQDNSTETIESYMKEDGRIVLLNHEQKEGTMKNRIDGIRIAKGKYITVLDGDDALIHKDILKNALAIANLANIDIVEFYGYMYSHSNLTAKVHTHKINGIIRQPKLKYWSILVSENYDFWRPIVCRTIWGKLIKNEIFQKALEQMGTKYTDDYILVYEDTMMNTALYRVAQSFYLYKEPGIYYSRDEFSGRYPSIPDKKCKTRQNVNRGVDSLKFINYLYEKLDNDEKGRKIICHEIISINAYNFSKFNKIINSDYDMFYRVVDGILDSKYLNEKEKNKLKEIKNEVMNKEKGIYL